MEVSKDFFAFWGAGLSTVLALVKFWEIWQDRRRVEVSYVFNGVPEIGNDIIIRNISDKPLILTWWELHFCKRRGLSWKSYYNENPGADASDLCMSPHSSKFINFREADYFDWGHKALAGKRIYLHMYIAGKKRPIKRLVYSGGRA